MQKVILVGIIVVLLLLVFGKRRGVLKAITPQEVRTKLKSNQKVILMDVRSKEEYQSGHIKGAVSMPFDRIGKDKMNKFPDKNQEIIVYCQPEGRSRAAAHKLKSLGYSNVYNLGGVSSWPYGLVK